MRPHALLALATALVSAQVPAPREHFGFTPGDDYKLADYTQIATYFQKLAKASDRIRLIEFGKSAHGKAMFLAVISSPENLKNLEHFRRISRRLALAEATEDEARRLAAEGKAIVWIDSGIHASEVAPVQHAPHLAHRMITGEDEETRRIRQNVILLQCPVINPDGLDWIAHWYRGNAGTPYELAPLPHLYQKYAGHDNNRDWFMLNLEETRHVTRLFYHEWFPQIIYNQHQAPAFPARIWTPPNSEPLNPNVPASVIEGVSMIGAAMRERFARENKPGVISYLGYDSWWNGGLRTTPYYHNMHGILTETAASGYATPRTYRAADLPERFSSGIPTRQPTVFYPLPWQGGRWTLRDAVDYMLTADFAILDLASARAPYFLWKAYESARAAVEKGRAGKPYAYVLSPEQWDRPTALDFLRRLHLGGVQVQKAQLAFRAGGKSYPEGTFVLPAAQPFRAYLVDLVESQHYPEIRAGGTGPTRRPYDIAGWTLSMQMGVALDRIDDPFAARLEPAASFDAPADSYDRRENASFRTTARLLARGARVRWGPDGEILAEGRAPAGQFEKGAWELSAPRVALYEPYTSNMDTGWTQYVLDSFQTPYAPLHNADVRKGGLRARFDAVVLASQSADSILHGARSGEPASRGRAGEVAVLQRPEFTGGIGIDGLQHLEQFVRDGGTLIALDAATELPVRFFPLPVRPLLTPAPGAEPPSSGYY
ncbi:MAG: M14 family metallopeptidase, partial [Bryobacteraceae bacterium]